jgi:hypothetical protein
MSIGLITPSEKHANLSAPLLNGSRAEASLVMHPCDELIELFLEPNFNGRHMPPAEKPEPRPSDINQPLIGSPVFAVTRQTR